MDVIWSPQRSLWDKALSTVPHAVQQSWAYGEAMVAMGGAVLRAQVKYERNTVALAQFTVRRFGGVVSTALCSLGPIWTQELNPIEKNAIFRGLRESLPLPRPRALLFTPGDWDYLRAMYKPMKRVMTGYSTVWMDLTPSLEDIRASAHQKWRNRLVKAEKSPLIVEPNGLKPAQYQWLLDHEKAQRKAKKYKATDAQLLIAFQKSAGKDSLLCLKASLEGQLVGGMMFMIHGSCATYHVGWTHEDGRRLSAHNLILWHAIEALKARGVTALDLGGVETYKAPGLARFKLGTGGEVITYPGTYLF